MLRVSEFVVSVIWFDDVYVSLFVAYAFHQVGLLISTHTHEMQHRQELLLVFTPRVSTSGNIPIDARIYR